jgi:hypothetical protein
MFLAYIILLDLAVVSNAIKQLEYCVLAAQMPSSVRIFVFFRVMLHIWLGTLKWAQALLKEDMSNALALHSGT